MYVAKKQTNCRRLVAIMLSVLMLMMQMPLNAFAVTVSDEVLTLENSVTVTGETQYAFTPTENGVYCFYSTTQDDTIDPVANLFDANKMHLAWNDDDGESMNFEISYELKAGVTYYVVASAYNDGAYSYTLSVKESDLSHIEIVTAPTCTLIENDTCNGNWMTDYDGKIVDRYFHYYIPEENVLENAVIKVHYKDGTSEQVSYYNAYGEPTGISSDWDFYQNPWKIGSDNQYYVTYKGMKALASATLVASPVSSMELTAIEHNTFFELNEATGQWSQYYGNIELDEPFFEYDIYTMRDSIVLSVTYTDGTIEQATVYDENGRYTGLSVYADQYLNPWTLGANSFEIWYKGACISGAASVVESPVESLRLVSDGGFTYTEFDTRNGHW